MANLPNQNQQNPSAENDMPPVKARQQQPNQNPADSEEAETETE